MFRLCFKVWSVAFLLGMCLVGAVSGLAGELPTIDDRADLLSEQQERQVIQSLSTHQQQCGVTLHLITLDSFKDVVRPSPDDAQIESVLAFIMPKRQHGVAATQSVLVLVSVLDRKVHIDLGATPTPGRQSAATRVINEVMIPRFEVQQFDSGVMLGVQKLLEAAPFQRPVQEVTMAEALMFITAVICVLCSCISLASTGRKGWCGQLVRSLSRLSLLGLCLIGRSLRIFQQPRVDDEWPHEDAVMSLSALRQPVSVVASRSHDVEVRRVQEFRQQATFE